MPIFEPDMSYEDMKKAADRFVCAVCGSGLSVAWAGWKNSWMLRCGKVLEHEGIVKKGRDPELDEIRNKLKGVPLPMETDEITKLGKDKMLARIDQARFPQELKPPEKALMAAVAIEYGLDPIFGELMIYQGKPYVGIDARRRKAQETKELEATSSRPMTKEERTARELEDGDYGAICEVWKKGSSHPFTGAGVVRKAEREKLIERANANRRDPYALPLVKDPFGMAEKRAESQALRRGFHLPLPSAEDIIDAEFVVVSKTRPQTDAKGKTAAPPAKPGPAGTGGKATQAQINKIWADSKAMGYTKEEVHAIIEKKWGVTSVADLTVPQASTLIDTIAAGEGLDKETPEE